MPPSRNCRVDPEYENRIQAAKADWLAGKFESITKAAHAYDVSQFIYLFFISFNIFGVRSHDKPSMIESTARSPDMLLFKSDKSLLLARRLSLSIGLITGHRVPNHLIPPTFDLLHIT
jgi:hypothetical protein